MEMMAESRGTPTAQKYPIRTISSGVAPSMSGGASGPVVLELVELVSGVVLPGPKMNGGLVIRATPLIMKREIKDLEVVKRPMVMFSPRLEHASGAWQGH